MTTFTCVPVTCRSVRTDVAMRRLRVGKSVATGEAVANKPAGDLCAGFETQLAKYVLDVDLHGVLRDHQCVRDLAIAHALTKQSKDFAFAVQQRRQL